MKVNGKLANPGDPPIWPLNSMCGYILNTEIVYENIICIHLTAFI